MVFDSGAIKKLYTGFGTYHYDLPISHFFKKYKRIACLNSSLKIGDRVLVFCCGTGLDFSYILKKIGPTGTIVGVDFSNDMLSIARKKVKKNNWNNIELIHADVTEIGSELDKDFDAAICTLGFSIIPEYEKAYNNMLSHVKSGGEIIIGDAQYASGWKAFFNPIIIFMGKRFGATKEGHKNSLKLCTKMKNELIDVKRKTFFLETYFICIGKKK